MINIDEIISPEELIAIYRDSEPIQMVILTGVLEGELLKMKPMYFPTREEFKYEGQTIVDINEHFIRCPDGFKYII